MVLTRGLTRVGYPNIALSRQPGAGLQYGRDWNSCNLGILRGVSLGNYEGPGPEHPESTVTSGAMGRLAHCPEPRADTPTAYQGRQ